MKRIPIFGVEASLPAVCGCLRFDDVQVAEDPRLGVIIRYQGPGTAHADAYLYNLGLSNITDDLGSREVYEWFQDSWQSILWMVEHGRYLDFEFLSSQFLYMPADAAEPFCLWNAFSYCRAPGPEVRFTGRNMSHLTLRTDHGFINKIRYTYPDIEEIRDAQLSAFLAFLFEWTGAVQHFYYSASE